MSASLAPEKDDATLQAAYGKLPAAARLNLLMDLLHAALDTSAVRQTLQLPHHQSCQLRKLRCNCPDDSCKGCRQKPRNGQSCTLCHI